MTRMKDSGIEWIGEVPEDWGTGKIKYYAEISAGSTPDRTNELFWNGDIPWMASGEVNQGVVTHTAEKITKLGLRNTSTKLLSKGTVMLALNGQGKTKGTAAILNIETASNQSLASFDVNNEFVNGYFLYYYFVANYSNIRGLKGEDRDGLNLKLVSNIEIPLPSIDEQLKIADFLDKKVAQLDKVKSLLEEQIKTLEDYRQSLIYETVTRGLDKTVSFKEVDNKWISVIPSDWEERKLRYLAQTRNEKILTENSDSYVGLENITPRTGLYIETESEVDLTENISFKQGDILFGKLRPYLRKFWKAEFDGTASSEFIIFKDSILDLEFLYWAIQSDSFVNDVNSSTYGSKMPRASWEYIKEIKIPFPVSQNEQKSIVKFLNEKVVQINQMIAIKKEQIENINKQRQTLIYDYVTGKRRV
ncbi:TPA: restriction endonuclease subunit S [Streptococcus suis]|nr:restriction endonuclease subunit S [Streptococcus suis]